MIAAISSAIYREPDFFTDSVSRPSLKKSKDALPAEQLDMRLAVFGQKDSAAWIFLLESPCNPRAAQLLQQQNGRQRRILICL